MDTSTLSAAHDRVCGLERRLRRTQAALACLALAGAAAIVFGMGAPEKAPDEIRTRRLVVVDDQGVPRVIIGQDPVNTQRRSRSAGITIHDKLGDERGGMGTMDDGSVVIALDAPRGVGSPMRDRLGLIVYPNGSSHVMLLDNETRAVAKLESDGKGGGGPQVFRWDMEQKQVHVKTFTFDGEDVQTVSLGE